MILVKACSSSFDDTGNGLSQPQPRQAAGFDDTDKSDYSGLDDNDKS